MSVSEFLAWSEGQPERTRLELIDGAPVAMSPERTRHGISKLDIAIALRSAIATSGCHCHVLPDGATVPVDEWNTYEPDALVYCGEQLPGDAVIVPAPVIVVEVLSPSSVHRDTVTKLQGYFRLASIRHYLIVDAEAVTVVHHARTGPDGPILTKVLSAGEIVLDPPGLRIAVPDFFATD